MCNVLSQVQCTETVWNSKLKTNFIPVSCFFFQFRNLKNSPVSQHTVTFPTGYRVWLYSRSWMLRSWVDCSADVWVCMCAWTSGTLIQWPVAVSVVFFMALFYEWNCVRGYGPVQRLITHTLVVSLGAHNSSGGRPYDVRTQRQDCLEWRQ